MSGVVVRDNCGWLSLKRVVGAGKGNMHVASPTGEDLLERLLVKALELHADSLDVEYKDGREEVCAMRGCVGVGIASLDSSSREARTLRERIRKIGKKGLNLTVDGNIHRLKVAVYDSFGEEAYRIEVPGKPTKAFRILPPKRGKS